MGKIFRHQLYPLSLALNYMYTYLQGAKVFFLLFSSRPNFELRRVDEPTQENLRDKAITTCKCQSIADPKACSFRPSTPDSPGSIIIAFSDSGATTSKPVPGSRQWGTSEKKRATGDYRKKSCKLSPRRTNEGYISTVKFQDQTLGPVEFVQLGDQFVPGL